MSQKQKTFAELFYLEEATLLERLQRDIRLIKWMWQFIMSWAKATGIRREFHGLFAGGVKRST